MNSRQIFISVFLLLFIISGVFLLLRRQGDAEVVASISLIFLLIGFLNPPIKPIFRLIERVYNLPFRWILGIICLFYLFSSFVQFVQEKRWYLTFPKIYGADEEHLLLMINSLIKDYDLELSNNYENARSGGYDAGEIWRYKYLDHHSVFVHKETRKKVHFWTVIDVGRDFSKWEVKDPMVWDNRDEYYARPHHPPGLPFVFAIFLWPFKGFKYLESLALIVNMLLVLLSFVCLYKILIGLGIEKIYCNISILLIAFATPFYHYSLLLMKEAFLGVILVISCWLYFFKKSGFMSGVCIVIGCATRYAMPVVIVPMALYGIIKKEWRLLINFLIGVCISSIFYMVYNYHIYGGPFTIGRETEFGGLLNVRNVSIIFLVIPAIAIMGWLLIRLSKMPEFINRNFGWIRPVFFGIGMLILLALFVRNANVRRILIDLDDGILPAALFLMFALFKFFDLRMWRDSRVVGIFSIVFSYTAIYILWRGFEQLSVYSARKFIPILPLLAVPLSFWYMANKSRVLRSLFICLAGYSFVVNFLAALARRYFWHLPLDQALIQLVKRWFGI